MLGGVCYCLWLWCHSSSVEEEELAVREGYLDTVRLDGDEAAERVSQWFQCEIEGEGYLRLLVGRHFDVYVMGGWGE